MLVLELILCWNQITAQELTEEWPVLKHYDQTHLSKIVFPIGEIGTGTVNLGGRGDLRQWEIMNIPGKQKPGGPTRNDLESIFPVFCLYTKTKDGKTVSKSLTDPLEYYKYETIDAKQVGFQARLVVGGYFIKMLEEKTNKK